MSDTHGTDVSVAEHGDTPLYPLPPHHHRITDTDPKAAKRAERQVAAMFALSALLTIGFVVCYVTIPTDTFIALGPIGTVQLSNLALGLCFGLAVLLIGLGAIQWAKKLMADEEIIGERHPLGSPRRTRTRRSRRSRPASPSRASPSATSSVARSSVR